jgi:hypothetical protein
MRNLLIASQWVVTAEHCLSTVAVGTPIRIGSHDRREGGTVVAVASVHKVDYGDIGLIELGNPVAEAPLHRIRRGSTALSLAPVE